MKVAFIGPGHMVKLLEGMTGTPLRLPAPPRTSGLLHPPPASPSPFTPADPLVPSDPLHLAASQE